LAALQTTQSHYKSSAYQNAAGVNRVAAIAIRGSNGFVWNTSLTRGDTGPGACEIVWVETLTVE